MKKKHLLVCNKSLLLLMPLVIASSILQECLHGNAFCGLDNVVWTWLHVIVCFVFVMLIVWHVQLNWGGADCWDVRVWYSRFRKHHSKGFKITTVICLLTAITGLIAVPVWLLHGHSGFGGWHGKIGFLCLIMTLIHVIHHWKWYKNA